MNDRGSLTLRYGLRGWINHELAPNPTECGTPRPNLLDLVSRRRLNRSLFAVIAYIREEACPTGLLAFRTLRQL